MDGKTGQAGPTMLKTDQPPARLLMLVMERNMKNKERGQGIPRVSERERTSGGERESDEAAWRRNRDRSVI